MAPVSKLIWLALAALAAALTLFAPVATAQGCGGGPSCYQDDSQCCTYTNNKYRHALIIMRNAHALIYSALAFVCIGPEPWCMRMPPRMLL